MPSFKANFDGEIRRFRLRGRTFAEIHSTLRSLYGIDQFVVKYKDEEGDFVTISTDSEVVEMRPDDTTGFYRLFVERPVAATSNKKAQ